jgi:arylsulfatase A-like enzyme
MNDLRRTALWLLAASAVPAGAALPAAAAQQRRPNVVYIMSDELAYYELSCMGNPYLKTPNIDRLAAEGVRFTQGLAGDSVCAPTRCCLMTGKHSGHTSVRKNDGGTPMRADEQTIASLLKSVGYATGGFGKWGCGGRGSTGVPEKHGFDTFVGYYDQVHAHSYYPAYIVRNSEELVLPGNRGGRSGQTYSHYVIMDEAMKFLRANKDRPFFCYLPITPPHGMWDIPDSDPAWAMFKDKPWPEEAKRYAAMVAMVDRNVGEVVGLLKQLGLDEQTIIFFCGDNGGQDRFASPDHPRGFFGPNVDPKTGRAFRGGKGNLYEGGLRIPMIVRWPGKIEPGRVSDLLWYFPDVLPTVAELAGVPAPKDIDGISVVPELLGPAAAGREQPQHEYLYWELGNQTAVRMGQWKAVRPRPTAPWELYDLDKDLGEQNDLAAEQPDVLAKMEAFAAAAHQPAEEGVFYDREIHEKDRQAKWGDTQPPAPAKRRPAEAARRAAG